MTTIKMPVYNEITEEYEGEKNVDLEKELSEHAIKELNLKPEIKEEPLVTGGGSEPKKNPTFLKVDGSNLPNRVKNLVKFTNGSDDRYLRTSKRQSLPSAISANAIEELYLFARVLVLCWFNVRDAKILFSFLVYN